MIEVLHGDITTIQTDAIVNAANEAFRGGGGVDGAIHRAAGAQLLEECKRYPRLPTGQAILTRGYLLPARFVIHTVGPIWQGGTAGEAVLLRSAYASVFSVARTRPDIRTIAFPAISTGVYGYPKRAAAQIAIEVMRTTSEDFERIVAVLFSRSDAEMYEQLLGD